MHSEGSAGHRSDCSKYEGESSISSGKFIHANPHYKSDENDKDRADLVFRHDELDCSFVDDRPDLYDA
jgi:hypothetical protein